MMSREEFNFGVKALIIGFVVVMYMFRPWALQSDGQPSESEVNTMGAKALEVNFDVIDAKRVANGLSQRDFGELIGRSTGWYCMSKRRGSMYKEDIEAVANLLGLKVAELIPRVEEPKDVPIIKIVKKEEPKVEMPVEEPKVDSMDWILDTVG